MTDFWPFAKGCTEIDLREKLYAIEVHMHLKIVNMCLFKRFKKKP